MSVKFWIKSLLNIVAYNYYKSTISPTCARKRMFFYYFNVKVHRLVVTHFSHHTIGHLENSNRQANALMLLIVCLLEEFFAVLSILVYV